MYDVLCAVVWVALCAVLSSCVWALMCLSVCVMLEFVCDVVWFDVYNVFVFVCVCDV